MTSRFSPLVLLPTPSPTDGPTPEVVVREAASLLTVAVAVAVALVAALVLGEIISAAVRAVGRRRPFTRLLSVRARRPLRVLLGVVLSWIAVRVAVDEPVWLPAVDHALLIATILAATWLVGALAFVAEDVATNRYRTDMADNRHARRVRTQIMVLRRLTVAVLSVCAVAAVLLTFEGARAAGAGLLASAGLLSVVVGMAAQSSLANMFAGLQLAFTDAIRVDDVVVVEDEWGRIEEITMTYVVVHLWDDRRLILPSTWFTTTPFQNWTRRAADLLGTVELDLDWRVPVPAMRRELTRLLEASDLWDRRVGVLQVTEATSGLVRVRALASAADAPTLFDLRCHVREALVGWLQRNHPEALPTTRLEQASDRGAPATEDAGAVDGDRRAAADEQADGTRTGTATIPHQRDGSPAPSLRGGADPTGAEPAGPAGATEEVGEDGAVIHDEGPSVRRRPVAQARQEHTPQLDCDSHASLFTGSDWATERSRSFSGPDADVTRQREETAAREHAELLDDGTARRR